MKDNDGMLALLQDIKELLQQLYVDYPMAKGNFIYMLHNQKQLALWQTENDDHE